MSVRLARRRRGRPPPEIIDIASYPMNAFEMRLSMHKDNLKNILTKFRLLGFLKQARNVYIQLRTKILCWIYPHGKYVVCNGGPVFVDFNNENYLWYYGYNKFLQQEHDAFGGRGAGGAPGGGGEGGARGGGGPS